MASRPLSCKTLPRKPLFCFMLIAMPGFFPAPAQAGFYSGNELFDICSTERNNPDYFEKTYECVGYISGAVDAFNTTRKVNNLKSCIPAGVTINQLKAVTVDYLRANPRDRDRASSASELVFAATRKAWPCKKKK